MKSWAQISKKLATPPTKKMNRKKTRHVAYKRLKTTTNRGKTTKLKLKVILRLMVFVPVLCLLIVILLLSMAV